MKNPSQRISLALLSLVVIVVLFSSFVGFFTSVAGTSSRGYTLIDREAISISASSGIGAMESLEEDEALVLSVHHPIIAHQRPQPVCGPAPEQFSFRTLISLPGFSTRILLALHHRLSI